MLKQQLIRLAGSFVFEIASGFKNITIRQARKCSSGFIHSFSRVITQMLF